MLAHLGLAVGVLEVADIVVDGATGQTKLWSAVCQSHTYTEGPVIADVNGDGEHDLLITSAYSGINGYRSGRVFVISSGVGR